MVGFFFCVREGAGDGMSNAGVDDRDGLRVLEARGVAGGRNKMLTAETWVWPFRWGATQTESVKGGGWAGAVCHLGQDCKTVCCCWYCVPVEAAVAVVAAEAWAVHTSTDGAQAATVAAQMEVSSADDAENVEQVDLVCQGAAGGLREHLSHRHKKMGLP